MVSLDRGIHQIFYMKNNNIDNIKAFIIIILWGVTASFAFTGLFFAYRYMWGSIETIPGDRIMVAVMGSLIFALISGIFTDWALTSKRHE